MLEFYQAYADFHDLLALTEELFVELAKKVCGTTTQIDYQGQTIDLTPHLGDASRIWIRSSKSMDSIPIFSLNVGKALQAAQKLEHPRRSQSGIDVGLDPIIRSDGGTHSHSTDIHYGLSSRDFPARPTQRLQSYAD